MRERRSSTSWPAVHFSPSCAQQSPNAEATTQYKVFQFLWDFDPTWKKEQISHILVSTAVGIMSTFLYLTTCISSTVVLLVKTHFSVCCTHITMHLTNKDSWILNLESLTIKRLDVKSFFHSRLKTSSGISISGVDNIQLIFVVLKRTVGDVFSWVGWSPSESYSAEGPIEPWASHFHW